jgi:hypothetical protein
MTVNGCPTDNPPIVACPEFETVTVTFTTVVFRMPSPRSYDVVIVAG